MGHGLYNAFRSINPPWPMGCTMLFLAMGHGLYNVVQTMGHGELTSHGTWVVQRFQKYQSSMAHGLYNVISGHGQWIVQHCTTHGPWRINIPRNMGCTTLSEVSILHGPWVVQRYSWPWAMDCTTLYNPWVMEN